MECELSFGSCCSSLSRTRAAQKLRQEQQVAIPSVRPSVAAGELYSFGCRIFAQTERRGCSASYPISGGGWSSTYLKMRMKVAQHDTFVKYQVENIPHPAFTRLLSRAGNTLCCPREGQRREERARGQKSRKRETAEVPDCASPSRPPPSARVSSPPHCRARDVLE